MPALMMQEDFPVGFAEPVEHTTHDDVFYVEWLDDSSEFPGLKSSADDNNLTTGNWELLQRKEVKEGEHTLESVENNAWSKLSTPGHHELYAEITEKNASELQPTKRTVQSLWLNKETTKKKGQETTVIDEDVYQDDLAYELVDTHKSQSRRANRLTAKRKMHDLKTVDFHVEGILRLATSNLGKSTTVTWVPYEKQPAQLHHERKKSLLDTCQQPLANVKVSNKSQALVFTAKYTQNAKRYALKYGIGPTEPKRRSYPDASEFSVLSAIVRE